jgi:hypothetical protein
MSTTIVSVLAAWLALNAVFVALRLYVSLNRISRNPISRADGLRARYPRLVRTTNQAVG